MSSEYRLTPSESVTVKRSEPEVLEVEAVYGPDGTPPPKHLHPAQAERFTVLEGRLTTKVDGVERELGQGEVLEVPTGAVHQMWNAGAEPARVTWETRPAGRTEEWFRGVDALQREPVTGGRARWRSGSCSTSTTTPSGSRSVRSRSWGR